MSLRECLISAVEQGAITREEAADLLERFEETRAQLKLSLGDDEAAAAAKAKLEAELRAEAREQRRRTLLADAARGRIAEYLQSYRGPDGKPDVFEAAINLIEHYGFAGASSVAGRAKAIVSLAHGRLADVLSTFRRSVVTGLRLNKPLAGDVVRELMGEPTGKPEVKAMADAIQQVFEDLRQRFNAAGGAIAKLERYVPQTHDARALLNAGRQRWKEFVRPRLDLERMRDPLTGDPLSPARLEQLLDAAFDAVTTDGWSKVTPRAQPHGRGALASQRAEHRVLHFKSADDWLAYNTEFGSGDPIRAIFDHINGMARDIAALEVLGPNPNATVEWIKQIVQTEAAKAVAGKPSLYKSRSKRAAKVADRIDYLGWRIDAVYQYVRGRRTVSNQVAAGFGAVRNLITSAVLGSASVLAAATDPFIDAAARYISGLPINATVLKPFVTALSRVSREEAVRSGLLLDDFLHIMGDEARFAGTLGGGELSRWLADRTLTLSLLEPLTQARKHVFAREFQAALADHVAKGWNDLPPYLRRTMEGYGLDRTAWDVMRQTPLARPEGGAGFLQPIDVAALADGPALPRVQKLLGIEGDVAAAREQARAGVRRIAEQYLEMILGQTERAVPSGTARARSFLTGVAPRGTVWGELLESGLQFKSFALSFTTLQLQAILQEGGLLSGRGAGYATALAIGLTLGGGLAMQIRHIIAGKDPQPMDDPRFWIQALQTGGGLGLLGDFMFADVNRFGHSLGEQLAGPTVGLLSDLMKLTAGNLQLAVQGEETHFGRETARFLGRYTPVLSSLFYTRLAYRRLFLDQLQYMLDPDAHQSFRNQQARARQETGQEFWWRPGAVAPERAPRVGERG